MATFFARVLMVVLGGIVGFIMGSTLGQRPATALAGAFLGLLAALLLISLEIYTERFNIEGAVPPIVGVLLGALTGQFVVSWISLTLPLQYQSGFENNRLFLSIVCMLVFGYLGLALGIRFKGDIRILPTMNLARSGVKIVDTSSIIDGRIADIAKSGFLEGTLVVPRFVLAELQGIADSADPLRRTRGRRGLDVLNELQRQSNVDVRVIDQDFPEETEVDAKLLRLANLLRGKIITNDFNLNKIAQFQNIQVLNVNALANTLKPVFLPDEHFEVHISKKGKEPDQGVGYLDDGTMIVVENANNRVGEDVMVSVTSVLQTSAGQMIFTRVAGKR